MNKLGDIVNMLVDIKYPFVYITLDYKGMKILCPTYGEEEEDEE